MTYIDQVSYTVRFQRVGRRVNIPDLIVDVNPVAAAQQISEHVHNHIAGNRYLTARYFTVQVGFPTGAGTVDDGRAGSFTVTRTSDLEVAVVCVRCAHQVEPIGNHTWIDKDGNTRCPESALPTPTPTGRNLFHRPPADTIIRAAPLASPGPS